MKVLDFQSDAGSLKTVGQKVVIRTRVRLGGLLPEDVTVEAYYGTMDHQGEFVDRETLLMRHVDQPEPGVFVFEGEIGCDRPGRFGYTVRVTPSRERLGNPYVLGLVTWA
jgi:starch phosphorylase